VSLSNDGERLAIGSPVANGVRGLVRVYRYVGDVWSQWGSDIELGDADVYLEVVARRCVLSRLLSLNQRFFCS
jgi:hypothetical protein